MMDLALSSAIPENQADGVRALDDLSIFQEAQIAAARSRGFIVPPERCATCAYRQGTEASKSALTLFKANLCLLGAGAFLCHERLQENTVCRGWIDAAAVRDAKGLPLEESFWRREVMGLILESIGETEDTLLVLETWKRYGIDFGSPEPLDVFQEIFTGKVRSANAGNPNPSSAAEESASI